MLEEIYESINEEPGVDLRRMTARQKFDLQGKMVQYRTSSFSGSNRVSSILSDEPPLKIRNSIGMRSNQSASRPFKTVEEYLSLGSG